MISKLVLFLFFSTSPCEEITFWNTLLNHKFSEKIEKRFKELKEKKCRIQYLSEAGGKIINLDYFPVTVRVLPKNQATGQQYTPEEFLTRIRLNSNHFVNKKMATFSASNLLGKEEESRWSSNNPVGALMHINIPFPAGDGSVICTEFTPTYWIYATIQTPWKIFGQGNDGKHPVTGIRQFGFTKNNDGSYIFFTKGVDRMSRKLMAIVAENTMKNPFKDADKLWQSMRIGIYDFVTQNGGSAIPLDSTKVEIHRFNWKDVKNCF